MLTSFPRSISFRRSYSSTPSPLDPYLHILQLLQLSITHQCLPLTQKLHAQIYSLGLSQDSFIASKLISSYSLCKLPLHSHNLFHSFHHKNIFLYNSIITAYLKNHIFKHPFLLFNHMCSRTHITPDNYTLATLFKVCSEIKNLGIGQMIHSWSLRMGFLSDTVLGNSLMAMYSKCGSVTDVHKVFDEMPQRNSATWNVMISGVAVSGGDWVLNEDIWKLVKQMQVEGVKMDAFTVSSLLPLCGIRIGKWDYAREIHCVVIKNEMYVDSDVHLGSCLIDMYSKRKNVRLSRWIFDQMKCRNVVAWTSMITGYVQNGCSNQALTLFREMQFGDRIEPNSVSLISVLPACNSLGVLLKGKQIHGFSIRKEYIHEVPLSNALIDMYSKCGNLDYGRRVFDSVAYCKDIISWSSMISGYGLNGKAGEAISLYNEMIRLGLKPESITLVGVLSACAKSGMVTEGLKIYSSAIDEYNISPTAEICACIVDMLGRSDQINKALEFVETMPVKPGPSVFGSLFGASGNHENSDMQELAYKSLIQLEPENASNYISLSNVYASRGKWDVVAEIRRKMRGRGLKKFPGCSWININNETHSFYVADHKHPYSGLLYEILDDLKVIMKSSGNISGFEALL